MKWNYINTGSNNGKFNMDFDLHLVRNFNPGEIIFRLYRWNPYCISLGANQDLNSIDVNKAQHDNIEIVKRPTGGRAILHSEELTYSVVYPIDFQTSARNVYNIINRAILKGLKNYHPILGEVKLEEEQPDLAKFYKNNEKSAVCFAVSAKSELKFARKKLVGSAQRKLGNTLLQHGSILCGSFHKKLVDYLVLNETKVEEIKSEIDNTTVDLHSIINEDIDYNLLSESLVKGFEYYFNTKMEKLHNSGLKYELISESV